ncbi:flagellar hook-basal body complex protein [Aliiruegeria sabulilitoris]|uniref:flagellar hook-basal body complex protein n=1 Tax=Aliiruegeria sabulilitoris TaxID=1510458 RepID=UPI00083126E5|nr:flagellar hook-basal body complex protein [Aliiruegeria sabulilitoris]NDR58532.1 flagellar hook-basal body complex protein [Pseudoruegeria sp. M32A2M]
MSAGYVTLSRQSGLLNEMQSIANNIANMSTTGFRREGVVFSEFIKSAGDADQSVSMAAARGRNLDLSQGSLEPTDGTFDVAIEGDGFFLVETPDGQRLTRAGSFLPGDMGDLMTPDGYFVLDEGAAPIFVPPDVGNVSIATDGTISADGRPLGRIGVVTPTDSASLKREGDTLFSAAEDFEPVEFPRVLQGFVEGSNVNPVIEMARMIEVQRSYELGQSFSERESKRLSSLIDTLSR